MLKMVVLCNLKGSGVIIVEDGVWVLCPHPWPKVTHSTQCPTNTK